MEILSYITRRASNAGAAVEHPNFTPTSAKPKFPQVTAVPVSSERKSELLKAAQSIASRVEASARATDWTYVMKKDGIDVSRITTATSAFQKFRGVGIIPHPLQDCVNCVVENEISIKFDTLMVQGDIIETLDDNKDHFVSILYMRYGAGVPTISDRDFLVLAICFKISRPEKDGGDYFVVGCDSIEHDGVPPFSDTWSVVRGELNTSGYLLEKKENGNATSITKIIQTDPKGLLPSWIMNMVATEEPCSIAKLGEFLTNHPEEYQQIISRVEEKRKAKAQ